MHFCYINMPSEYYSPVSGGAIATVIMNQAKELIARGHKVSVLTITGEDAAYPVGEVIPIDSRERHQLNPLQRIVSRLQRQLHQWDYAYYEYYLRSFSKALRDLKPAPDVVILNNDLASPRYIKRILPQTRVVVWLQNEQRTRQRKLDSTIHSVERFVSVSNYITNWAGKRYDIPESKLATVLSGVDLDAFYPRENFLDRQNPVRVLFVGRLDPNKGPQISADAIAVLQEEGHRIHFTVAGGVWFYRRPEDDNHPFFLEMKNKMETTQAEYLGHVPRARMPEVFRQADIVCVLSKTEPFGLVALEAMASGCAVLAGNRDGLPESCGGAAWLVDPDDFDEVVVALRTLVTNEDLLRSYKHNSVERAARASWSQNVDQLERLLNSEI